MSAAIEHPGDLVGQADELEREADQMMAVVRGKRAEAAKLRARAERVNHGRSVVAVRKTGLDDSLLAAAALAVEDLPETFQAADLDRALGMRDTARAVRLLTALVELGNVEQRESGWRAVDPMTARVRDAVIELGVFTEAELAERVGVPAITVRWYVADLRGRGIVSLEKDGDVYAYQPTGPERAVTRRPRRRPPEAEVIDKDARESRGQVVEFTGRPLIESGGNRRQAGERKRKGGTVRKHKR